MYIDTFLKKGKGHEICEDYIISGEFPFPYIILSDGCSSSLNTDVGARILCHVAEKLLLSTAPEYENWTYFGNEVISEAMPIAALIGIPNTCLDATLIISYLQDSKVTCITYGDGNILYKGNKTIEFEIHRTSIQYTPNVPYYLSYVFDKKVNENYKNSEIKKTVNSLWDELGIGGKICEELIHISKPEIKIIPIENSPIIISSDGIESFNTGTNKIISELMSFKTTKGKFIKKRMKKMIKNYEKQGIIHTDDIAIGGYSNEQ